MTNISEQIHNFIETKSQNDKEESSVYSDACSNSFEIQIVNKKEKKNKDSKNNIKNDEKVEGKKYEIINTDNQYNDKINNYNHKNKNFSYQYETYNINTNSSFSVSDYSFNNRRGSGNSINSTKSSLFTKNIKNLKKIKIDIPKKGYLNNRYIINNKQLLTPIEEKDKGTYGYSPSILSCENKIPNKNVNFEDKGVNFLRQTLDPKNKKFLFSPEIQKKINNIKEIKNDNKRKGSINSSNKSISNIKKKLFNKNNFTYSGDEINNNDNNINLEDIEIN